MVSELSVLEYKLFSGGPNLGNEIGEFFFEGFRASIEVILFLRIPKHVEVYARIFIWNLGCVFLGF